MNIALPSGPTLHDCRRRLELFYAAEYPYYDGIPDETPNVITPIDVLATVSMNSRVDTGTKVQRVHKAMAAVCNNALPMIPADADLLRFDPDLTIGNNLLAGCLTSPGVGPAVATKVLHRKRPGYIPILDNVVLIFYLDALRVRSQLEPRLSYKPRVIEAVMPVWKAFRQDLAGVIETVTLLTDGLRSAGYRATPLRTLEVLIWMEVEPRGWYPLADTSASADTVLTS